MHYIRQKMAKYRMGYDKNPEQWKGEEPGKILR